MTTKLQCPATSQLEKYLLGKLAADEAESIESHLDRCQRCFETLQELPAEDTTVTAIRQAGRARNSDGHSARVTRLTDRLRGAVASVPRPVSEDVAGLLRRMQPPQSPDELGRFGSYRLLKVLGSGGMAVVFLAEDMHLRRRVALKMLKPAVAAKKGARQRFLREAQAAAAIRHENIVAIYQVGEEDGTAYMALEYLEGEPLDALLMREGTLPIEPALALARQMAEGLSAAHLQGLIHRDIKPSNIFLVRTDSAEPGEMSGGLSSEALPRVKLFDFGLARPASDDIHLTQEGTVLGTPAFMAPEQARRETVDRRCDIFSLGCVFYRMCTGVLPFRGDDTMAVLMSLAVDDPIPPRELNPEIPPALSDLIVRMLAKRPDDRPASIAEVINALIAIERRDNPPAGSGPMPLVRLSGAAPVIRTGQTAGIKTAAPRGRGLKLGALGLGISAFAMILCTIIYIQTDNGQLIVESNDINIEVVARRAGARIVDQESGRAYDVRIGEQRLPSGQYRLEVSESSGLEFNADEFEIKRGREKRLKVSLRQTVQPGAVVDGSTPVTSVLQAQRDRPPPEFPTHQWLAEDLKLGKIAAPDFSDKTPLYDVDCAVPEKRLLRGEGESEFSARAYRGDRFIIRYKHTGSLQFSSLSCDRVNGSFAFEATARLTLALEDEAPPGIDLKGLFARDKWGLLLLDREQRGVAVKLMRDGTMYYSGPPKKVTEIPGDRPGPVTHAKILTGDQDNTLLLIKTDRYLETYVNGVAVAQPLRLNADFEPGLALLAFFPNVNGSQVEFRRVRIWSAEHLPPLAQRGATLANLPQSRFAPAEQGAAQGPLASSDYSAYTSLAFWYTADQLITHEEVIEELKLTADQRESIRQAQAEYEQARAAIDQGTARSSTEYARKIVETSNKRIAAIRAALGDKTARLDQIAAQSAGLAHLFVTRPNLRAPELGLTRQQVANGQFLLRAVYNDMGPSVSAERRALFVDRTTPKLLELLTDEQKRRWQEAIGEPAPAALIAKVRSGPERVFPAIARTDHASGVAKELEGTWIVQSVTLDGREIFPRKGGQVVFIGDTVTTTPAEGSHWTQKFTIDASKTPNEIDYEYVGDPVPKAFEQNRTMFGIFELDGDTLTLCIHGLNRPTEFSDKGQRLLVLTRKK